jgi:hypothetical protein
MVSGFPSLKMKDLISGRKFERRPDRPIRDAHDESDLAAMLKVLLHSVAKKTEGDVAAEQAAKFFEAADMDRLIQRASLSPANECGDGRTEQRYRMVAVEPALSF